ncbi:MAG: hypothetical protein ACJ763_14270 [Bdellovibrionia bacterium]
MKLHLSIYGIGVEILAHRLEIASVLENLGKDFDYFRVEQPDSEIRIRLELKASEFDLSAEHPGPRLFKTKMCDVHGLGPYRFCNYGQGVWVKAVNSPSIRNFSVFGMAPDLIYEAAYVALLSSIGEELDQLGYHRLHSVGVQVNGAGAALAADSGQGKSATAILLGQNAGVKVFSDEMPLIRQGVIYPFPIRMALHPHIATSLGLNPSGTRQFKRKIYPTKALFEISRDAVAQPSPLRFLFVGVSGGVAQARPLQVFERSKFVIAFVLGLGLPQMAEHMLRANNILSLGRIAVSRLFTAFSLLGWGRSHTRAYAFVLTRNARENAQSLSTELEKLSLQNDPKLF